MHFEVISLFPEMFNAITQSGITSRALTRALYSIEVTNPRMYTQDNHKTVDDRPYGGGPGMVMLIEPLANAINAAKTRLLAKGVVPLCHSYVTTRFATDA